MPLYLAPVLFLGKKYGGCLYCLLLPLLLWAFNSLPKSGAALMHLVTVPLLGLLAPEQIARQYLCVDVLNVVLLLFMVVVTDRWSEVVLSMAYGVCARFGLRRKRLFVAVCLGAFAASLLSGSVMSVTLLYFLDRVMATIFKENMDRPPDDIARLAQRGSLQDTSSLQSLTEPAADAALFDRLAQIVMTLKKPQQKAGQRKKTREEARGVEKSGSDAVAADAAPATLSVGQPTGLYEGMAAQVGTTSAPLDGPSSARPSPYLHSDEDLVPYDLRNIKEALTPGHPFSAANKDRRLVHHKRKEHRRHRASLPTPSETKGDELMRSHSGMGSSIGIKKAVKRSRNFSIMFWREPEDHESRATKSAESTSPAPKRKPPSRFFRSLSIMASRLKRNRISKTHVNQASDDRPVERPDLSTRSAPPELRSLDSGSRLAGENPAPEQRNTSCPNGKATSSSELLPHNKQYDSTAQIPAAAATSLNTEVIIPVAIMSSYITREHAPASVKAASNPPYAADVAAVASRDGPSVRDALVAHESENPLVAKPVSHLQPHARESEMGPRDDPLGETAAALKSDPESRSGGKVDSATEDKHPVEEVTKDRYEGKTNAAMTTSLKDGPTPAKESDGKNSHSIARQPKHTLRVNKKGRPSGKRSGESSRKSSDRSSTHSKSTESIGKQQQPTSKDTEVPLRSGANIDVSCEPKHIIQASKAFPLDKKKQHPGLCGPETQRPSCGLPGEKRKVKSKKEFDKWGSDSLDNRTEPHYPHLITTASVGVPPDVEPVLPTAKESDRCSQSPSVSLVSAGGRKLQAIEAFPYPPRETKQQSRRVTKHEAIAAVTEKPKCISSNENRGSSRSAGFLHKCPSKQLDAVDVNGVAMSGHGLALEKHRQSQDSAHHRGSLGSKSTLKTHSDSDILTVDGPISERKEAFKSKEVPARNVPCAEAPFIFTTVDVDASLLPDKAVKTMQKGTGLESARPVETAELFQPAQPAAIQENLGSLHSMPTAMAVPSVNQPVRSSSLASVAKFSDPIGTDVGVQVHRRKQSTVSFDAGIRGTQEHKPLSLTKVPEALAHLEDISSRHKRRSTILKASSSLSTASRAQRASSVDFGVAKCAIISPAHKLRCASVSGHVADSSHLSRTSAGSSSSLLQGKERYPMRQPITLRRTMRNRGSGFDETVTRHFMTASHIGSHVGSQLNKNAKRHPDARVSLTRSPEHSYVVMTLELSGLLLAAVLSLPRADVHNAFLLGTSLMTVLGNTCSFHRGTNKTALLIASHASEGTDPTLNIITWMMVTLPGALVALCACTALIWLLYVRPHDPGPLCIENEAVMAAAKEESAKRGKRRGVQCACAMYLAIFSLSYVPSILHGLEPQWQMVDGAAMWRQRYHSCQILFSIAVAADDGDFRSILTHLTRGALIGGLTSMVLATALLTSCLQAAFEFIRRVWQMVPWGVILLLGSTHVASELVQAHQLLEQAFRLVPGSFWEECTVLEVQTMLAFAASLMAEIADKHVLLEIMNPMVVQLADLKQIYRAYYAIPVVVGASSNVIMPASVPIALLHELSRVSFWKLLLLGLFAKILVMSTVIVTVNMADRAGLLSNHTSLS